MPITTIFESTENTKQPSAADRIEEMLIDKHSGRPSLIAEAVGAFFESVDYTALFEDADIKPFVVVEDLCVKEETPGDKRSRLIFCSPDDEKCIGYLTCEVLDGAIAAEFMDEADMSGLFSYFVNEELPNESMEDKVVLGLFADVLTEGKTPFKKGDFRKGAYAKVSGASKGQDLNKHNERVRMMLAMQGKGAIVRVAKGTGYKKGDWKKGPGYGSGTPSGIKRYRLLSSKNPKRAGQIKKMVDPGRRKVVQMIYQNLGRAMPSGWVPPERRFKGKLKAGMMNIKAAKAKAGAAKEAAKSKAKALFTAKPKGAAKAGKGMDDSVQQPRQSNELTEGARLAAGVLTRTTRVDRINEDGRVSKPAAAAAATAAASNAVTSPSATRQLTESLLKTPSIASKVLND